VFFVVAEAVLLLVGIPLVKAPAVVPPDALLEALLVVAAEVAVVVTFVAEANAAQLLVKSAAIAPMGHSGQF
jgi:hypothetical protein